MSGSERDARIRAAGMVQAVIASGAPIQEHRVRAAYGLGLTDYFAQRLLGKKVTPPKLPNMGEENS
jgi:hypothetical protein